MRYALIVGAAALLAGCSILEDTVQRGFQRSTIGNHPATYTTADIRVVSLRPHPLGGREIMCAEPSPDVARALATALSISAEISGKGGGSFGGGSAEAVAELAGRTTALLGLRDGLYRTCEAYANGIIGDDAYALVLSRYGQLMTTLFLGQDIAAAEGKAAAADLAKASIGNIDFKFTGTTTNVETSPPKEKPKAEIGQHRRLAASVGLAPASTTPDGAAKRKLADASFNQLIQLASLDPRNLGLPRTASSGGAPRPTTPVTLGQSVTNEESAGAGDSGTRQPPQKAATSTVQTTQRTSSQPAMTAADALRRMNAQYLFQNLSHPLLIACVNEFDQSRYMGVPLVTGPPPGSTRTGNAFLKRLCGKVEQYDLAELIALSREGPEFTHQSQTRRTRRR